MQEMITENWQLIGLSLVVLAQCALMLWMWSILRETRKQLYEARLAWHRVLKRVAEKANDLER